MDKLINVTVPLAIILVYLVVAGDFLNLRFEWTTHDQA